MHVLGVPNLALISKSKFIIQLAIIKFSPHCAQENKNGTRAILLTLYYSQHGRRY
jgi:hypothetical protein